MACCCRPLLYLKVGRGNPAPTGAEKQVDKAVLECVDLTEEDTAFLERVEDGLGILADLSRADALLYCLCSPERATVIAQARPHSILPIYSKSVLGTQVGVTDEPGILHALTAGRKGVAEVWKGNSARQSPAKGAPIVQEAFPLRAADRRVVGAVCIETNLIERERHSRRSKVFRQALKQFQAAALAGVLHGVEQLTPFSEHDGVLVVDAQRRIQYVSGIATSLYRKLGYTGNLLRRYIEDLELDDQTLALECLDRGRCLESEARVGELVWVKKAIPLFAFRKGVGRILSKMDATPRLEGVLVMIHDDTDSRRQEEELRVKTAMIQEIHHRVKNNMQTIASLLRLQSRRTDSEQVQRALQESINRILSVAVIHEFLAHQDARVINIRDVCQRIINQIQESVLDSERAIRLDLRGPNIYLPTQPATVCALVINELLQNSLEHGYDRPKGGTVTVNLKDDGEQITISVDDDGVGLPEDFDLSQTSSLGLQIIKTLAEGDLRGAFELHGRDKGVSAIVTFPKHAQGGR